MWDLFVERRHFKFQNEKSKRVNFFLKHSVHASQHVSTPAANREAVKTTPLEAKEEATWISLVTSCSSGIRIEFHLVHVCFDFSLSQLILSHTCVNAYGCCLLTVWSFSELQTVVEPPSEIDIRTDNLLVHWLYSNHKYACRILPLHHCSYYGNQIQSIGCWRHWRSVSAYWIELMSHVVCTQLMTVSSSHIKYSAAVVLHSKRFSLMNNFFDVLLTPWKRSLGW